jgi:ribonucleotide reductase alpha subunit
MAIKYGSKSESFATICNDIDRGLLKAEFHDAQDLRVGDLAVFPIPQYVCDIESLTEDDCRMYGILVASRHYKNQDNITIKYKNMENNMKNMQFIASYLNSLGYYIDNSEENLRRYITFPMTTPKFKFTLNQFTTPNLYELYCPDGNDTGLLGNHIDNAFIHLPVNKIKQILLGFLDMVYENYYSYGYDDAFYFKSEESAILNAINYMALRCGVLSMLSLHRNSNCDYNADYNHFNDSIAKLKHDLTHLDDKQIVSDTYFRHGNNIYTPIKCIGEYEYEGILHDFEIGGSHDYTTAMLGVAHNGGGKRAGSIAMYIEPWHADIEDFLKLKLNTGIEEERTRDLFLAVWVSDLFMKRVESDEQWTLMCPDECPDLYLKYGQEFEDLYLKYEREGRGRRTISARIIWEQILKAQMETGIPYIGFKDAINIKNNQKNLGTIQSSNLCHEICEFTSRDEIAVCNLASIALPKFIEYNKDNVLFYNFEKLREVIKQIVKNLNKIINYNYYPVKEAETSNRRHLPIGLGVQGLADTFAIMKYAFDSEDARLLNRQIFENMYYAALESSMEIARKRKKYVQEYKRLSKLGSGPNAGELTEEDRKRLDELRQTYFIIDEELKLPNQYAGAYSSFVGSPLSEGKFQFDLWNVEPSENMKELWANLRTDIMKHGVRNSLLIALMPTASTSQILGWNECIEPFTNNIYTRKTLAGTFVVVNKYLINDLLELGIWNQNIKDKIILADGSVQDIPEIPQALKDRYKNVWEIKQKTLIDLSSERGPFVCQTQSLNLFVKNPTFKTLTAMHFYSWKKGNKTGIYYLRSQPKATAQKFSVDLEKVKQPQITGNINDKDVAQKVQPHVQVEEPPECIMCSS